jgi:hypothetical protein
MTVSISAPAAVAGDPIWLSPTTAGGMVFGAANKPFAPNHIVYLGVVTRKTGNTVVEIYVKIQNGAELDELSDVLISSPVAGQALMRGATLWENRSIVAADISDLGTLATQDGTFSGTSSGTNTGDQDLSGYATTSDLADYLPLAGGTMDVDAEIIFDGGSKIRETPGTVGVEEVCANDYIHRWQSGSLYITQQGPNYWIRSVQYGFTSPPSIYQDENAQYQIGSRFILDDGTAYVCTNATAGAAIWELEEAAELLEPTTAYELSDPTAGTFRGQRIKYHIQPDGAAIDLTINAAIAIPSDSGITFPKTLVDGETYIVALEWIGTKWMLTTLIGGGI